MKFSKKNNEHHKNNSSFVSKKIKSKITLFVAVFLLTIVDVNSQINIPKNNTLKKVELKNNKYKDLKLITGGNQGFVYEETAILTIGKKIGNAEIVFKSENGKITKKVKTDNYGNYKVTLKPARYVVSIKHYGYKFYSTAPGFTVINNKFSTLNIPLKKTKKISTFIIIVFDSKTKKIKDRIWYKDMKEYKKNDPNSIFIYSTINTQNRKYITTLHLDKQFIFRKSSRVSPSITPTKTKPFVPSNKFKIGSIILLRHRENRVISSTKKEIKLIMIQP